MNLKVIIKSRRTGLYVKDETSKMTSDQNEAIVFSSEVYARIFLNTHDFIPSEYSLVTIDVPEYLPNMNNVIKDDKVNHPKHYNSYSFEVVDVIDEVVPNYPASYSGHIQNAIKYIFRAPFKGTLKEDLNKAVWYLNHAIEIIDKDN